MGDVAEREAEQRRQTYTLELACTVVRALMSGDREAQVTGYGPTPATSIATAVVETPSDEGKVFAHALGFHDALLRDGGGYQVPDDMGAAYEEGHRTGAECNRDRVFAAPREKQ